MEPADTGTPAGTDTTTYFALRAGLVVLAALLLGAIAIQAIISGCLESSISLYYYTPARSSFVAALGAIGACLIIYRGNGDVENALLDVAGFLVVVVTFVPENVDPDDGRCAAVGGGGDETGLIVNVSALIGAALLALVINALAAERRTDGPAADPSAASTRPRPATVALVLCAVLLTALVVFFALDRDGFARQAHPIAAVGFFASILAVIAVNAWSTHHRAYRWCYQALLVAPVSAGVGILIGGALDPGFRTSTFWLEAVGIVAFLGFWVVQTAELRGQVVRPPADGAARRVAPGP